MCAIGIKSILGGIGLAQHPSHASQIRYNPQKYRLCPFRGITQLLTALLIHTANTAVSARLRLGRALGSLAIVRL